MSVLSVSESQPRSGFHCEGSCQEGSSGTCKQSRQWTWIPLPHKSAHYIRSHLKQNKLIKNQQPRIRFGNPNPRKLISPCSLKPSHRPTSLRLGSAFVHSFFPNWPHILFDGALCEGLHAAIASRFPILQEVVVLKPCFLRQLLWTPQSSSPSTLRMVGDLVRKPLKVFDVKERSPHVTTWRSALR